MKIVDLAIKNERNDIFIDFGCGNGRVLNFFSNKYSSLLGFDINLKYLNKKNIIVKKIDLRKISKLKKQLIHLISKSKILYFYDPFGEQLTKKIIERFSANGNLIILINLNIKMKKKYKTIFKKQFF